MIVDPQSSQQHVGLQNAVGVKESRSNKDLNLFYLVFIHMT